VELSGRRTLIAEMPAKIWSLSLSKSKRYLAAAIARPGYGGIAWLDLDENQQTKIVVESLKDVTAGAFSRHPSRDLFAIGSHRSGVILVDGSRKLTHNQDVEGTHLWSSGINVPVAIPGEAFSPEDAAINYSAVAFDPSGRYVFAGHTLGQVVVWDLRDGTEIARTNSGRFVTDLSVLADGTVVVSGLELRYDN
jgi:WD40 repeat protein